MAQTKTSTPIIGMYSGGMAFFISVVIVTGKQDSIKR
jgi:hypothetical protein